MAGLTRLLSKSTIRPASGDCHSDFNRRIELTPNDLQQIWRDYTHRGLLFNKPNVSPVEHLKDTLALALDRIYPLAGRLVATEHDGDVETVSFHVECNGAGATFVHAEAVNRLMMADILDPIVIPMDIVGCLFPMIGVSSHQAAGSNLPLVAVQVTEFADGVFVGVSRSHSVVDGTTFWNFLNVWSELARRDSAAISQRRGFFFGRECFDGLIDFSVRIPFRHSNAPLGLVPPPPVQQRIFRFSKESIAVLKTKANAETPKADREISSLQAVMAHLWVCITRSRALNEDDIVILMTVVDMRPRLRPPLPRSYVGNGVLYSVVRCTAGELLGRGMGWAARQINTAIAARTGMKARDFFDDFVEKCASPSDYANIPANTLRFGGSHRNDLYGNDFGWGRPLASRSGLGSMGDGFLNVFPGAVEGGVDFEAILLAGTFDALARDSELTQYLQ